MTNKLIYSYNEIDGICRKGAKHVKKAFKPDIILAIGGGGLIPARMMRNDIKAPIYVVSISTYDENNKAIDNPRIVQWMDFSGLKDKKILIVDEVDDTRKTLKFLINKLNNEGFNRENLGVFVIHNKLKKKEIEIYHLNISYYYSGEDVKDNWIVYPWD